MRSLNSGIRFALRSKTARAHDMPVRESGANVVSQHAVRFKRPLLGFGRVVVYMRCKLPDDKFLKDIGDGS